MELDGIEYRLDEELEKELLYSILEEKMDSEEDDSQNQKPKLRKKYSSKKLKTKVKHELSIRSVLLILLTLIANTYAWFIYNTTVSSDIKVHIKSWHFDLEAGDISSDFVFRVDEIYPGMDNVTSTINATNSGESDAKVTCSIKYVKILDQEYFTEPDNPDDIDPNATYYTSEELLDMLLNDYPFKIQIYIDGVLYDGNTDIIIEGESSQTDIEYRVVWPYETGNTVNEIASGDAVDTFWGEAAYDYYQNQNVVDSSSEGYYCIEVRVTIIATQINDSEPEPDPGP